eukprot:jgi/Galph1/1256/GphlegSOOS_G6069.1
MMNLRSIPLWVCWLFFLVSVALEGAGTTCMKASNSFQKVSCGCSFIFRLRSKTQRWPSVGAFLCYNLCVLTMVIAYTKIEMTIGYAVWCGLGIILTTLAGIFVFGERLTFPKVIGMLITLIGILILVWFQEDSGKETQSNSTRLPEEEMLDSSRCFFPSEKETLNL